MAVLYVLYGVRTSFNDAPAFGFPRIGALPALIIWRVLLHFAMKRDPPLLEDLDEVVELKAYDPSWPVSFDQPEKFAAALDGAQATMVESPSK